LTLEWYPFFFGLSSYWKSLVPVLVCLGAVADQGAGTTVLQPGTSFSNPASKMLRASIIWFLRFPFGIVGIEKYGNFYNPRFSICFATFAMDLLVTFLPLYINHTFPNA
jgi:hypothetical protein